MRHNLSAITAFGQFRQRYDDTRQTVGGGLGIYTYLHRPWYFKIDAAAAKVAEKLVDGTYRARTQTDDILFSGGYIVPIGERFKVALSGLFGVPTHKSFALEGIQFGTGHVGIGAQADGSYAYSSNFNHTIIGAARIVHFFPRNTAVRAGLQCRTFDVHPGNAVDIYISHKSTWQQHNVEVGYNPIFSLGAFAVPSIQEIADNAHAIRNNFFGNYRFTFLLANHLNAILAGISYGFDKRTTDIGIRRGITIWAGWGINF
jgi:hypothetical protein